MHFSHPVPLGGRGARWCRANRGVAENRPYPEEAGEREMALAEADRNW